jgi:AcrR family transcriptional regulator
MSKPESTPISSSVCRARLIEAARQVFLEEGYRASVDRIAARAGVAKQTLYNHFPAKAELFGEVVKIGTAEILVSLEDDGTPLRERLLRFSRLFRLKVLGPEGLAFYRALAAETPRFPELAATFYASGPAQTAQRVAEALRHAMEAGVLHGEEPEFAADMLLSMLVGKERTCRLFAGATHATEDHAYTERVVDTFLRAFAPDSAHLTPDPHRSTT